jgi:hypothetical protein
MTRAARHVLPMVKGRDDDVGQAAILLERGGMADQRYCLAFDRADAAERIAAEGTPHLP